MLKRSPLQLHSFCEEFNKEKSLSVIGWSKTQIPEAYLFLFFNFKYKVLGYVDESSGVSFCLNQLQAIFLPTVTSDCIILDLYTMEEFAFTGSLV